MGYRVYGKETFEKLKKQYNIMALVGNGFDIQVLNEYDHHPTTRYQDFYYYMKMKGLASENLVLEQMEEMKKAGRKDWSDVEESVASLAHDRPDDEEKIASSLKDVQQAFSEYLNYVVDSSLLSRLSDDAEENTWGTQSLSKFLKDIDNETDFMKIPFAGRKENHDLYNFYFVNFNYTSLLDNYLYLDSHQFEPHPYKESQTNFWFNTNPRLFDPSRGWGYTSYNYIAMDVVHPHGYQDIPRSLLFGTGDSNGSTSEAKRLSKLYWAQVDEKYQHLFENTNLFVVFGCSLGTTDGWWWGNIADALLDDTQKALIIYWWNPDSGDVLSKDDVLEKYFLSADVTDSGEKDTLRKQTCIIPYHTGDERVWLSTQAQTADEAPDADADDID